MSRKSNLALVVDNTSKALHPRLIVIEYSGGQSLAFTVRKRNHGIAVMWQRVPKWGHQP